MHARWRATTPPCYHRSYIFFYSNSMVSAAIKLRAKSPSHTMEFLTSKISHIEHASVVDLQQKMYIYIYIIYIIIWWNWLRELHGIVVGWRVLTSLSLSLYRHKALNTNKTKRKTEVRRKFNFIGEHFYVVINVRSCEVICYTFRDNIKRRIWMTVVGFV